mmetsp:Transcript_28672/g.51048  ORF Transcript_28672/g.51048 Transcript_28672/m.51048 type:complete len:174 (-) Transcript_28672:345-866(-)
MLMRDNAARGMRIIRSDWVDYHSIFTENTAITAGCAEIEMDSSAFLHYTEITKNSKTLAGGAFMLTTNGTLTCNYCTISDNSSVLSGGAFYVDKLSTLHLKHSAITRNTSKLGSAITMNFPSNSTIHNFTFTENYSSEQMSIDLQNANVTFTDSVIANKLQLQHLLLSLVRQS